MLREVDPIEDLRHGAPTTFRWWRSRRATTHGRPGATTPVNGCAKAVAVIPQAVPVAVVPRVEADSAETVEAVMAKSACVSTAAHVSIAAAMPAAGHGR